MTLCSGRSAGSLWYALYAPHRRLVHTNLRFCHPEWPRERMRQVAKGVFENAGITLVETLRMPFMTRERVLDTMRVRGEEHLREALGSGRGVIIVTAHTGNWELGAQFLHCHTGRPFKLVIKRLGNGLLDRFLHHARTRHGVEIIDKKGAWPKMVAAVRAGDMLAITIDQSKTRGIDVSFLGRPASVGPAPALLALRTKSVVLPVFSLREPGGALALRILPPIELRRTGNLSSDLEHNTQLMTDAVEAIIREHPEQWIWFQRPWRKAHPELYPEWAARRRRRNKNKRKAYA